LHNLPSFLIHPPAHPSGGRASEVRGRGTGGGRGGGREEAAKAPQWDGRGGGGGGSKAGRREEGREGRVDPGDDGKMTGLLRDESDIHVLQGQSGQVAGTREGGREGGRKGGREDSGETVCQKLQHSVGRQEDDGLPSKKEGKERRVRGSDNTEREGRI
jgi:hypothetical protein